MSASEKLKALDAVTRPREQVTQAAVDANVVLLNAIPQIVAVVEAAELALDSEELWELKAALAALDEALS